MIDLVGGEQQTRGRCGCDSSTGRKTGFILLAVRTNVTLTFSSI